MKSCVFRDLLWVGIYHIFFMSHDVSRRTQAKCELCELAIIQVVDTFSHFGLVAFCKKQNSMAKWAQEEDFILHFKFKGLGYKIEYICCNTAGENKKPLECLCNQWLGINCP
jgi:hypothetical protein